jgi:hypothetical protein
MRLVWGADAKSARRGYSREASDDENRLASFDPSGSKMGVEERHATCLELRFFGPLPNASRTLFLQPSIYSNDLRGDAASINRTRRATRWRRPDATTQKDLVSVKLLRVFPHAFIDESTVAAIESTSMRQIVVFGDRASYAPLLSPV